MHANRTPVTCDAALARIKALGIPPAYRDVWICPKSNGHIQATGVDAAGRKQYRHHEHWTKFRSLKKFENLSGFSAVLPAIRRKTASVLKYTGPASALPKEVAIAAAVRLIDRSAVRVGERSKKARGATTLKKTNVRYDKDQIHLRYVAKGGKRVQCTLRDSILTKGLRKMESLPGKHLFQYAAADGQVHAVRSCDVNQWLKDISHADFVTAKMFRTWHGSVAALEGLSKTKRPTIKMVSKRAASRLRNTPAIARKSYIHPSVLDLIDLPSATEKQL